MSVPINDIISIARVSQYLSSSEISVRSSLRGGFLDMDLPQHIYTLRQAVEWKYNREPYDLSLRYVADYLYALCGQWIKKAKEILKDYPQGGIIDPITGQLVMLNTITQTYVVGASGSPFQDGDTEVDLPFSYVSIGSVNLSIDGLILPFGLNDRLSYSVVYQPGGIKIVFNNPIFTGQVIVLELIRLIPQ